MAVTRRNTFAWYWFEKILQNVACYQQFIVWVFCGYKELGRGWRRGARRSKDKGTPCRRVVGVFCVDAFDDPPKCDGRGAYRGKFSDNPEMAHWKSSDQDIKKLSQHLHGSGSDVR